MGMLECIYGYVWCVWHANECCVRTRCPTPLSTPVVSALDASRADMMCALNNRAVSLRLAEL
jgi:hypothetical protein